MTAPKFFVKKKSESKTRLAFVLKFSFNAKSNTTKV
jgi:hypothetical protein